MSGAEIWKFAKLPDDPNLPMPPHMAEVAARAVIDWSTGMNEGSRAMDELKARQDTEVLIHALFAIATESNDVESVRIAMVSMYETDTGRAFLAANPMKF